jgi:hypothetical protein
MKKILYACGDSFMYGMECLGDMDKSKENKELAFPKYLSDMMGCSQYINNSLCGATNEFIFRKTVLDLDKFEKDGVNPQDVFVVIGITSLHRVEIDGDRFYEPIDQDFVKASYTLPQFPIEYLETKTIFINPGSGYATTHNGVEVDSKKLIIPWCSQFIWTETVQLPQQEARMIALHELLKAKGYDHVFVNTVCPLLRTSYIDIDCKNYHNITVDSFYGFANFKHPIEKRAWNHFSPKPHKEYSEILYDYINKHQLS